MVRDTVKVALACAVIATGLIYATNKISLTAGCKATIIHGMQQSNPGLLIYLQAKDELDDLLSKACEKALTTP